MFVTLNQIYVFISCIAFGAIFGIVYSTFAFLSDALRLKKLRFISDIAYFVIFSIVFLFYSYVNNFSNIRAYMILGVFLGNYLYVKSFNIMLAKFLKRIYNISRNKKMGKKANERK